MNKAKIAYITNVIDGLVESTGYPVAGSVIRQSGLATRAELRYMEHKGVLKSCYVSAGKGALSAYYTEGVIPNAIKQKQANNSEPTPSEVELQGGRPSTEIGREVCEEGRSGDGYEEAKEVYKEIYGEDYDSQDTEDQHQEG